MINLVLALGSLLGYVLIGTLYYRHQYIRRVVARRSGEKAPGFHASGSYSGCASRKSEYRHHICGDRCYLNTYSGDLGCQGPVKYMECDCHWPAVAASLWWLVPFVLAGHLAVAVVYKLAHPTLTPPQTRLEKLEEQNSQLEEELRKMGVKLGG